MKEEEGDRAGGDSPWSERKIAEALEETRRDCEEIWGGNLKPEQIGRWRGAWADSSADAFSLFCSSQVSPTQQHLSLFFFFFSSFLFYLLLCMMLIIERCLSFHSDYIWQYWYKCTFIHSLSFAASLIDWNLISLVNLLLFFAIRFTTPRRGMYVCLCLFLLLEVNY